MKTTPDPLDRPLVIPPAAPKPAAPAERWVQHPEHKDLEVNVAAPGEHKPMRTKDMRT